VLGQSWEGEGAAADFWLGEPGPGPGPGGTRSPLGLLAAAVRWRLGKKKETRRDERGKECRRCSADWW